MEHHDNNVIGGICFEPEIAEAIRLYWEAADGAVKALLGSIENFAQEVEKLRSLNRRKPADINMIIQLQQLSPVYVESTTRAGQRFIQQQNKYRQQYHSRKFK